MGAERLGLAHAEVPERPRRRDETAVDEPARARGRAGGLRAAGPPRGGRPSGRPVERGPGRPGLAPPLRLTRLPRARGAVASPPGGSRRGGRATRRETDGATRA